MEGMTHTVALYHVDLRGIYLGVSQGIEETFESKISSASARVGAQLTGEVDKRIQGLNHHVDFQVGGGGRKRGRDIMEEGGDMDV